MKVKQVISVPYQTWQHNLTKLEAILDADRRTGWIAGIDAAGGGEVLLVIEAQSRKLLNPVVEQVMETVRGAA